ncbi:MAG: gfo/Idh/MocA family oxidoreductase, partial [Planctomycetes bacterium]|nr:gfo/Idh/MocA family oxidoreductase [Planctomycetota bacterium]
GATAFDPQGKRIRHFPGDSGVTHQANFIAAMRSRKANDLEAEILQCHISTGYCHAANISHLVGRESPPDQIAEAIRENELLAESFGRMTDHLKANEVDFSKTPLTAGAKLTLDVEKERFTGEAAERTNMLLRRNYRRPFVVPDDV